MDKIDIIQDSDLPADAKSIGSILAAVAASNDVIIESMVKACSSLESEKNKVEAPKMPKGLTKTQKIIYKMLIENTGCHIMDSGGDYGRAWQQNRKKDITQEPKINDDGIKSLYHFLVDHLEFDPILDQKFKQFSKRKSDQSDWQLMREFAEIKNNPEMIDRPICDNSYNVDNCLSQDIQYCIFFDDYNEKVIIQSHNGADIRGGYSTPRVFNIKEDFEYFLIDMIRNEDQ